MITGDGSYNCWYLSCGDYLEPPASINDFVEANNLIHYNYNNEPKASLPILIHLFNKNSMVLDGQTYSADCSYGTYVFTEYGQNIDNTGTDIMAVKVGLGVYGTIYSSSTCSLPFSGAASGITYGASYAAVSTDNSGIFTTIYPPDPNTNPLQGCQCTIVNTGATGVFTTWNASCTVNEDPCVECWLESGINPSWLLNPSGYPVPSGVQIQVCDVAPIIVSVSFSGVPHFNMLNNSYELEWCNSYWQGAYVLNDTNTDNSIDRRMIKIRVEPVIGKPTASGNVLCPFDNVNYFVSLFAQTNSYCQSILYREYTDCRPRLCGSLSSFTISDKVPRANTIFNPIGLENKYWSVDCLGENSWYYYLGSGVPPTGMGITITY
jgi:hypothetical protein